MKLMDSTFSGFIRDIEERVIYKKSGDRCFGHKKKDQRLGSSNLWSFFLRGDGGT